ncbi:uncharacterized protein LOC110055715 [Orbicella faveolata]|uniref:uncharacterized protein LOC110055715 n=1 Tax=Orbicella faveolata TaxID=48498 RepID=UPI0009E1F8F1|nr:uncharacterized protein LOC110055715 [Orbicella faveolata]
MTMKDSEGAREMEELTDTMIMSLMEEMKALTYANKEVDNKSSSDATGEPSSLDEMKNVLTLYEGIIEQLWKIAENIAKTSAVEEQHAGTVFMGSSGDGTYIPELSSKFDTYVMEEDSQYELQKDLEAMDTDFTEKNPEDRSHMLKVLPTKKTGCFLLTWSDYGLELKRRYEENLARQQSQRGASAAPEGPVPIFSRLVEFTEEIEHEGEKIQVISPHKIRVQQLKNPPSSTQGWPVWFRMQDQNSPAVTLMTEEEKDLGKTKIQVTDLVLAVRTTMPCLKEDWVKEKQNTTKWLTQDQLKRLKDMRCSVVAKSWESKETNLTVWRISYSGLERECVNAIPPEPKICLIIIKAIRRKFLSKPKGLISYHVKTVLFYTLDKTGSDWKKSERENNILGLLQSLAEALKSRSLPVYFEPRLNTLESMDAETAAELEKKVREIIRSPRILLQGCLFQSLDEDHKKEHFEKGKEINPVWFDEKPPEPSMFGEINPQD